jgi:hypothetical protein
MAVVTAATTNSGQGIFKIFKFSSVDDGDTFTGPSSPRAFWAFTSADATTQASAGINVAESSGTYTFYPGEDSLACTLFVVE